MSQGAEAKNERRERARLFEDEAASVVAEKWAVPARVQFTENRWPVVRRRVRVSEVQLTIEPVGRSGRWLVMWKCDCARWSGIL